MKSGRRIPVRELKPEDLKWECDTESFQFRSTEQIDPIETIIGQERALKALKIGVDLNNRGYNIFVTGLSGTGKMTTIKRMLEKISPEASNLFDYAYVNNFTNPDSPHLLILPKGEASKFRSSLSEAVKFILETVPRVLEQDPFLSKKKSAIESYGERQQKLFLSLENELKKKGFSLGQTKEGELTKPEIFYLVDGKGALISQIPQLVRDGKIAAKEEKNITKEYVSLQEKLQQVLRENIRLSQKFQAKLRLLEQESVSLILSESFNQLRRQYGFDCTLKFLNDAEATITEDLSYFQDGENSHDLWHDLDVNIILDNSKASGCPVIIETSPTFSNIFGTIEKFPDSQGIISDFTSIKAGSILKANGGFLIINAQDALSETDVWRTLKRVLLYGNLEIQESSGAYQSSQLLLKPEPIEVSTKIILIGSNYTYSVLNNMEDDFNKIFKIKADFDYEMKRTENSLLEFAGVVKHIIKEEGLKEFDSSAMSSLAELGARYAGEKGKLTTRFSYIADIAREADFWARDTGDQIITSYQIQEAYRARRERYGLYESKIRGMLQNGTILIDTEGERCGQVNGLSVYELEDMVFGKPVRITATVSKGRGDIINVEREAGLSGSGYDKAILIISGYFREMFGRNRAIRFDANLVFEQQYSTVDGDSASAAEIIALMSALSGIPVIQSLSITGSINQKGDIQPIGGINEKIEGFFDLCFQRGLKGNQGVVIPAKNVENLMLKNEVIGAVKEGKFHIYPVSRIEEAASLLLKKKPGKIFSEVGKGIKDVSRRKKWKKKI